MSLRSLSLHRFLTLMLLLCVMPGLVAAEALLSRTRLPDMTSMAAMVAVDGYALLFGGSTNREVSSGQVIMIDPATADAWHYGQLPVGSRYLAAAGTEMDIYMFGGVSVDQARRRWTIRPTAEAIETLPVYDVFQLVDERFARRTAGAAAVGNEIVLAGGGVAQRDERVCIDGLARTDSVIAFDTLSGAITQLPPLPMGREGAIAAIGKTIWIVGGFDGCNALNQVWTLARSESGWASEWTEVGELPAPVSAHAMTAAGTDLFLFGDYEELGRVWRIDTQTLTVEAVKDSGYQPRRHAAAVTVDERIIVAGGNSSTRVDGRVSLHNEVEIFSVDGLRSRGDHLATIEPAQVESVADR